MSHIEAVNGKRVCRRDASFNRDLHRCQSLFQRAAFVMCAVYARAPIKRGIPGHSKVFFFFFLYPRHSVVIRSIRDKQCVCVDILMKEIELEMIDIIFALF